MGFAGRDLISINDFTNEEIESVLDLADGMNSALESGTQLDLCKGMDMATLFYEPSTRTRGSFERAMHKLGGTVISVAEAQVTSSAAKGETIADSVRVWERYVDIIVMRHPWEGAAKVAADYAHVPVINAGDGTHEHPTQTLCDLYSLRKNKGTIRDLVVVLWGDLKNGRTVHSLIYALARFGATPLCCTEPHLEPPKALVDNLRRQFGHILKKVNPHDLHNLITRGLVDALYISPFKSHQLPMLGLGGASSIEFTFTEVFDKPRDVDAVYVTRLQIERGNEPTDMDLEQRYSILNGEILGELKKKGTILVMHPLPRVNELPHEYDSYPKSVYFEEAGYGVPVRMALAALLLGVRHVEPPAARPVDRQLEVFVHETAQDTYKELHGVNCPNESCVSYQEGEKRYITPKFRILTAQPLSLSCVYCDNEVYPPYIASSKWHTGTLDKKMYYSANSLMLGRIQPENLIIFGSEEQALAWAFKPGKRALLR